MAFVAVDKDGAEAIYMDPPYRNSEDWNPLQFPDGDDTYWIYLPKGSIRKLIGRELTWMDEPVELKEAISKKLTESSEVSYEQVQQRLKEAFAPPQPEATISGWVCRDKDGTLCLYYNKPMRGKEEWFGNYNRQLPEESFPSVTWQDDPIEVEITIKPKKQ